MNIEELKKNISDNDAVMIYFSGENCGVCTVLSPKIKSAVSLNYPKLKQLYISATEFKNTAAEMGVFSMPTIVVFFEGKEFLRKSRHISVDGFIDDLNRPYSLFFGQ
ncbi:MAG: thioredoxin family protein [Campylobacterota bacterium]|nr:thioredoxin family protein [Campylobacterota bacterium]